MFETKQFRLQRKQMKLGKFNYFGKVAVIKIFEFWKFVTNASKSHLQILSIKYY